MSIKMFGPLLFNTKRPQADKINEEVQCLFCDDTFNLKIGLLIFLNHCVEVHNLIIEDIGGISDLSEYVLQFFVLRKWILKFEIYL